MLWIPVITMSESDNNLPQSQPYGATTPSVAFASSSTPPAESNRLKSGVDTAAQEHAETGKAIPLLPPPDPDSNLPSIKLGETKSFEEMGPVIINSDGTTRRIDNWDTLTEKEREVAWRRISKRNEERRKLLLEQQQQQSEGDGEL